MPVASTPRRAAILTCARVCAEQAARELALDDAGPNPHDPLGDELRAEADAAACHARFYGRIDALAPPARPFEPGASPGHPVAGDVAAALAREQSYFQALGRARAEALGAAWLRGVAANLRLLPPPPSGDDAATLQAQISTWFRDTAWHPQRSAASASTPLPAVSPALREWLPALKDALHDESRFARLARQASAALASQAGSRDRSGGGLLRWFNPRSRPLRNRHLVSAAGQSARARAPEDPTGIEQPLDALPENERPDAGRPSNAAAASAGTPPRHDENPSEQNPDLLLPYELLEHYRVFTRAHDRVESAHKLAHPEELERLRHRLDRAVAPYRSVMQRLAHRLQRRLLASSQARWLHEQEEGELDPARLAQFVAQPLERSIFRQLQEAPGGPTAVTLLIDNSGSMRGHPMAIAAVTVDLLAQTLERCRIPTEILGFTTTDRRQSAAWHDWQAAGSPAEPGRLNGLQHIVYKSMDTPWRRCRRDLGLMLKDEILRENVDGEALWWASQRLRVRPEPRRLLIVISDGAPRDTDTLAANPGHYLDHHLHQVIRWIHDRTDISLHAIGIGHPVHRYYPSAVTLRNVEGLGEVLTRSVGDWITGQTQPGRRTPAPPRTQP